MLSNLNPLFQTNKNTNSHLRNDVFVRVEKNLDFLKFFYNFKIFWNFVTLFKSMNKQNWLCFFYSWMLYDNLYIEKIKIVVKYAYDLYSMTKKEKLQSMDRIFLNNLKKTHVSFFLFICCFLLTTKTIKIINTLLVFEFPRLRRYVFFFYHNIY